MKTIKNRLKQIGLRIENRRKNLCIDNVDLADRCRLSPGYIAEVECGFRVLSFSALKRISKVLKTSPEELLTGKRVNPLYCADEKTLVKIRKIINLLKSINLQKVWRG